RGLDGEFFGVSPFDPGVEDAEDGLTDSEITRAFATRGHHAGKITAQDVGEPKCAMPAETRFVVGGVNTRRVNIDQNLPWPSRWVWRVAITQHLRPAVARQQNRLHGC